MGFEIRSSEPNELGASWFEPMALEPRHIEPSQEQALRAKFLVTLMRRIVTIDPDYHCSGFDNLLINSTQPLSSELKMLGHLSGGERRDLIGGSDPVDVMYSEILSATLLARFEYRKNPNAFMGNVEGTYAEQIVLALKTHHSFFEQQEYC